MNSEQKKITQELEDVLSLLNKEVKITDADITELKLRSNDKEVILREKQETYEFLKNLLPELNDIISTISEKNGNELCYQGNGEIENKIIEKKTALDVTPGAKLETETIINNIMQESKKNTAIQEPVRPSQSARKNMAHNSQLFIKSSEQTSSVNNPQTIFISNHSKNLPSIDLLDKPQTNSYTCTEEELETNARLIESILADYKISVEVVAAHQGPVITLFELKLSPGVKVSRITNLTTDLARSLLVVSVRVVEVMEGLSTVGLEIPNKIRQTVYISDVFNSPAFNSSDEKLPLVLGQDISGTSVVADPSTIGDFFTLMINGRNNAYISWDLIRNCRHLRYNFK